jgi:predicted flap endonuclease-1-like 5' DNA nuclease
MDIHQTKNTAAIGLLVVAIFLILNYIVYSRPAGDWWLPLLLLLLAALLWFVVGRPRAAAEVETSAVAAPVERELLPSDAAEAAPVIAASVPSAAVVEAPPVAEPVVVEAAATSPEPAPVVETLVEAEPAPAVEPVVAAYSAPAAEPSSEVSKPKARSKKEKVTTIAAADNLQRIEGIGPKMAKALNSAGIETFAQLADADEAKLRGAIEAGGLRFAPSLPTWAKQAKYLADGDEIGFQTYVDSLTAGRA